MSETVAVYPYHDLPDISISTGKCQAGLDSHISPQRHTKLERVSKLRDDQGRGTEEVMNPPVGFATSSPLLRR